MEPHTKHPLKPCAIHLPTTVGAGAHGLSKALSHLQIKSTICSFYDNYLQYPIDKVILKHSDTLLQREYKRIIFLSKILDFDLIFYNYGSTLFSPPLPSEARSYPRLLWPLHSLYRFYLLCMQHLEISLLRLLRKPFFILYQGDDIRQGKHLRQTYELSLANVVPQNYYSPSDDKQKSFVANYLAKHATAIFYFNPDLYPLLCPKSIFIPYCHVTPPSSSSTIPKLETGQPLRICHAPTHKSVKGTHLILTALNQLKTEGFLFEFDLIENVSHSEALRRISQSHLLIDQLYAGWYGGVALEAMSMGIPVASYLRHTDFHVLPKGMYHDLPIIHISPHTLQADIRSILQMSPAHFNDIAIQSRHYADVWHSSTYVASILQTAIPSRFLPNAD